MKVQEACEFSGFGGLLRGKAFGAVSKKKKLDHARRRKCVPELLGIRGGRRGSNEGCRHGKRIMPLWASGEDRMDHRLARPLRCPNHIS